MYKVILPMLGMMVISQFSMAFEGRASMAELRQWRIENTSEKQVQPESKEKACVHEVCESKAEVCSCCNEQEPTKT